PLLCSRRIFLASIMVAAKFLQDKTFSNRAWSKITGLPVKELANVEREFLAGIQWDLNVKDEEWKAWTARLAS
ncbi:cyclin-domain-containing protein, partial [Microstroma glucosiphilum]